MFYFILMTFVLSVLPDSLASKVTAALEKRNLELSSCQNCKAIWWKVNGNLVLNGCH